MDRIRVGNGTGSPLYHEHLQRNVLGQITRIEERWGGGALKVSTYGYDLAGRLDSVAVDGVVTRRYSFDANGNRTQERGVNGLLLANGVYDDQDRLLSYGNIGEPVPPGQDSVSYVMGVTYEWSAAGELMRRTENGGSESRYSYDALGNLPLLPSFGPPAGPSCLTRPTVVLGGLLPKKCVGCWA